MRVLELVPPEVRQNGPLEELEDVELLQDKERRGHPDDQGHQRPDDSPAELLEVVEERHLRVVTEVSGRPHHTLRAARLFVAGSELLAREIRLIRARIFVDDALKNLTGFTVALCPLEKEAVLVQRGCGSRCARVRRHDQAVY